MNFLELCRSTREKCGISGNGPASVSGQSGEMLRIVNWVNEAWMEIQNLQTSWMWMRGEFTLSVVPGQSAYDKTLAVPSGVFSHWHLDTLRTVGATSSDEQHLTHVGYRQFRDTYLFSTRPTGRPSFFTVRPWDMALLLSPIPDAACTVQGEYQKSAQPLVANGDVPGLPTQYHMLIVYEAMKRYAAYEAAPEVMLGVREERQRMMAALMANQLMPAEAAETLA